MYSSSRLTISTQLWIVQSSEISYTFHGNCCFLIEIHHRNTTHVQRIDRISHWKISQIIWINYIKSKSRTHFRKVIRPLDINKKIYLDFKFDFSICMRIQIRSNIKNDKINIYNLVNYLELTLISAQILFRTEHENGS